MCLVIDDEVNSFRISRSQQTISTYEFDINGWLWDRYGHNYVIVGML